jgi:FkbM family methyltransferase
MIRLDYNEKHPNILVKKWYKSLFAVRYRLAGRVEVIDGDQRYRFRCENLREYSRCVKMFVKEPGTCRWMKSNIEPGEIVYDVGANIGVYTVLAAKRVGTGGKVYAFEPHGASFVRLLQNIVVNNLQDGVVASNIALDAEQGFFTFEYLHIDAGQSGSQLLSQDNVTSAEHPGEVSEMKYAASIDSLIASGGFERPDHVKIDVDGRELPILRGMTGLLSGINPPKSLQVEMDSLREAQIIEFLESHHYGLTDKHYTRAIQKRLAKGKGPENLHYNAIFQQKG